MTFLELCQRVQLESSLGGSSAIAQVQNQTGDLAKIVNWVQAAWRELQSERREWSFKWQAFTVVLTAGSQDYNLVQLIDNTTPDIQLAEGPLVLFGTYGRRRLDRMDFDLFMDRYLNLDASSGIPLAVTILPDRQTIRFEVSLETDSSLTGSYYVENQELTVNGDVPIMPVKYHDAIVYGALKKYAEYDEADRIFATASANYDRWHDLMVRDLLPKVLVGAPGIPS